MSTKSRQALTLIVLVLVASTFGLNETYVPLLRFGRPSIRLDFLRVLGNARSSAFSLGLSANSVCKSSISVIGFGLGST